MVYIYVLKLEQEKYYIGKTNNPQFRLDNHFTSNGSEWTKIYKPVFLLELRPNCDDYDEDKVTRQYMDKYGIENVRGGSFVSIKLNKSTIDHLQQMSNGTNNKCFTCGCIGHFTNNCTNKKKQDTNRTTQYINEDLNEYICDYYDSDDYEEVEYKPNNTYKSNIIHRPTVIYKNNNKCFRCGRTGHYATSCYASTNSKGKYL
jgi:cellular nucleic acid-binding protein